MVIRRGRQLPSARAAEAMGGKRESESAISPQIRLLLIAGLANRADKCGRPACSKQPYISFRSFDHIIHLSAPYLLGQAKGEAFGCVERNMRRQ